MTNDEIRSLIATLERESERTMDQFTTETDLGRAREQYGRARGIEYAIGTLEACMRDE